MRWRKTSEGAEPDDTVMMNWTDQIKEQEKETKRRRDAWPGREAEKGRERTVSGEQPETDGVNCFCSTLRSTPLSPPCDNANAADVGGYTPYCRQQQTLRPTDRPTVQHWLLITVAEALMALGNLVVIKFNMPNTNYCYVSRFTLSNVTLCQWLCLVPLCLVRCMSSCFSAFNDWTPEKAEASLKCPIDKGAPFWWPTQHSLTGARQSSCAHL